MASWNFSGSPFFTGPTVPTANMATPPAGQYLAGYTPSGGFNAFPYTATGNYTLTPHLTAGGVINYTPSWPDQAPPPSATPSTAGAPAAPSASTPSQYAPPATPVTNPETIGGVIPETNASGRWVKADYVYMRVNPVDGVANILLSAGKSFFKPNPACECTKLRADGGIVYDKAAGITLDGITAIRTQDGSEDQEPDALLVAEFGADGCTAHRELIIVAVEGIDLPRWFKGTPPASWEAYIEDEAGGTLWRAWGGTWNDEDRAGDISLSGGFLVADNTGSGAGGGAQASVRGTQARANGRYTFGITANVAQGVDGSGLGMGIALAAETSQLDFYMGSQASNSWRWAATGEHYINGVLSGSFVPYSSGEDIQIFVDLDARTVIGVTASAPDVFYGDGNGSGPGGTYTYADMAADTAVGQSIATVAGADPLYPALTLAVDADQATGLFDEDALFIEMPGQAGDYALSDILIEIGEHGENGYTAGDITVDASVTDRVPGPYFMLATTKRDQWLAISRAFNLVIVEGDTINFRKMVDSANNFIEDGEVDPDDLLRGSDDDGGMTFTVADQERSPREVIVNYFDQTQSWHQLPSPARRPRGLDAEPSTDSERSDTINLQLLLSALQARTCAASVVYREDTGRSSFSCELPWSYLGIQQGDIRRLPFNDTTFLALVLRSDLTPELCPSIRAVMLQEVNDTEVAGDPGLINNGDPDFVPGVTGVAGVLDFSKRRNSGFIALLEDI